MNQLSFPTKLEPTLINMCSHTHNEEQIVEILSESPDNLFKFFEAAILDKDWYGAHVSLARKIVRKIIVLNKDGDNTALVKRMADTLEFIKCYLPNYSHPTEGSLLKKLRDSVLTSAEFRHLDKIILPEVLELAVASRKIGIIDYCVRKFCDMYGAKITSSDLKKRYIYITISLPNPEFKYIVGLISKIKAIFKIYVEFSPAKDFDLTALKEAISICQMDCGALNLTRLGSKITEEVLSELLQLLESGSAAWDLLLAGDSIKQIELKNLNNIMTIDCSKCTALESITIHNAANFVKIHCPFTVQTLDLENLSSLNTLSIHNLLQLKTLRLVNLPNLQEIGLNLNVNIESFFLNHVGSTRNPLTFM